MLAHLGRDVVSTHSRPKAAAEPFADNSPRLLVSTHSRPKAAVGTGGGGVLWFVVSTHSRPKAAAPCNGQEAVIHQPFQLTAARRRLQAVAVRGLFVWFVSTHSRPKAAAAMRLPRRG